LVRVGAARKRDGGRGAHSVLEQVCPVIASEIDGGRATDGGGDQLVRVAATRVRDAVTVPHSGAGSAPSSPVKLIVATVPPA